MNLAAIGEAAAATASDYKALVCIFLFGGNDYANTVTPTISRPTISTTACAARSPSRATPRPTIALPDQRPARRPAICAGAEPRAARPGLRRRPAGRGAQRRYPDPADQQDQLHQQDRCRCRPSSSRITTSRASGRRRTRKARPRAGRRIGDLLQSGNGAPALTCINASGNASISPGAVRCNMA